MPFSAHSLSMLARGGAFTLWRYESADASADLSGGDYFLPAGGILRRGDLIVCADPAPAGRRTALLVVEASPARVSLEPLQSQGPSSVAALMDVQIADPRPEEVLTFTDGRWSNRPAAGRAGDAHAALPGNPHGASAADVGAIAASERGRPGGVATLDDDGRLSVQQLRQVALAGLRDVLADNPQIGDVLKFDGAAWTAKADAGAAGDAFAASHAGSAGTAAHAPATATEAGFMAAADKQKLDRIEPGATADQTGAELVSAIDAELGSGDWRQDASAWGQFHGKSLGSALVDKAGAIDVDVASVVASLPQTRAISAPEGEDPSISLELPAAVDRRDFLLAFSATGAVTTTKVATAADMDALVARGLKTVPSMEGLRATRGAAAGDLVFLRGYYTPLDGGEGFFSWNPKASGLDNGGTIIAPVPASAGRWERSVSGGAINVKWFGARGDGLADDTLALQSAIRAATSVFLPRGTYRTSATLVATTQQVLHGQSRDLSKIVADNVAGPIIGTPGSAGETAYHPRIVIKNLGFSGKATAGLSLIQAQNSTLCCLHFDGNVELDFIHLARSYGTRVTDVSVRMEKDAAGNRFGIAGRSCIFCDSDSHATYMEHIYTSTYTPYGIYIDNLFRPSSVRSSGITIVMATLQGHDVGLHACDCKGLCVSGLYTENTVIPVRLGDRSNKKYVSGATVSGGFLLGPKEYHPRRAEATAAIEMSYCFNICISGVVFASVPPGAGNEYTTGKAATVDLSRRITFLSCDVPGDYTNTLLSYISAMPTADPGSVKSITVI